MSEPLSVSPELPSNLEAQWGESRVFIHDLPDIIEDTHNAPYIPLFATSGPPPYLSSIFVGAKREVDTNTGQKEFVWYSSMQFSDDGRYFADGSTLERRYGTLMQRLWGHGIDQVVNHGDGISASEIESNNLYCNGVFEVKGFNFFGSMRQDGFLTISNFPPPTSAHLEGTTIVEQYPNGYDISKNSDMVDLAESFAKVFMAVMAYSKTVGESSKVASIAHKVGKLLFNPYQTQAANLSQRFVFKSTRPEAQSKPTSQQHWLSKDHTFNPITGMWVPNYTAEELIENSLTGNTSKESDRFRSSLEWHRYYRDSPSTNIENPVDHWGNHNGPQMPYPEDSIERQSYIEDYQSWLRTYAGGPPGPQADKSFEAWLHTQYSPRSIEHRKSDIERGAETQDSKPEHHSSKYVSDAVEQVEPQYSLETIGGLEDIKQEIKDIALAFQRPEIMEKWGASRPRGILFYGESGTGKTMLAHAIAKETESALWVVDSSSLYDMWVSLSGKNMQKIFDSVKAYDGRLVVFFDEIDSIIGITDTTGPGGAGSERNQVAGIFKQNLNTLAADNPNVLIVGATNNLERIDPSLIRSGRFDYKIYVPLPDTEARKQIVSTILAGRILSSRVKPELIGSDINVPDVAKATEGMSGADINEIIARVVRKKAMHEARTGKVEPITQADIIRATRHFRESG